MLNKELSNELRSQADQHDADISAMEIDNLKVVVDEMLSRKGAESSNSKIATRKETRSEKDKK